MEMVKFERDVSTSVAEAHERYIRIKRVKNLSPDTLKHYAIHYKYFADWFNPNKPCRDITSDTHYGYIEHLQDTRNANSTTINTYLSSLRNFFYWLMDEG